MTSVVFLNDSSYLWMPNHSTSLSYSGGERLLVWQSEESRGLSFPYFELEMTGA